MNLRKWSFKCDHSALRNIKWRTRKEVHSAPWVNCVNFRCQELVCLCSVFSLFWRHTHTRTSAGKSIASSQVQQGRRYRWELPGTSTTVRQQSSSGVVVGARERERERGSGRKSCQPYRLSLTICHWYTSHPTAPGCQHNRPKTFYYTAVLCFVLRNCPPPSHTSPPVAWFASQVCTDVSMSFYYFYINNWR